MYTNCDPDVWQSYVQDGLVAQFDAIENVGVGRHENAPAVWKDLKGGASIAVPSGAGWIDRAYDSKRITHTIKGMPEFYLDSVSTEVAMNRIENGPANNYPPSPPPAEYSQIHWIHG